MTTPAVAVDRRRAWRTMFVVLAVLAGVWLFARSIEAIGIDGIRDGLVRVGWGFVIILALSGAREVSRTLAWMRTIEGDARPTFAQAFRSRLVGEALSTLLPMGMVVGEPAKAAGVGPSVPFAQAFAGLVVEFVFYAASLVPVMIAGLLAFMVVTQVRMATWIVVANALVAGAAVVVAVLQSLRTTIGRPLVRNRLAAISSQGTSWTALARVRRAMNVLLGFGSRRPEHLLPIARHEAFYQVLAVAEVYVTLWFINGRAPTVASAIVLETVGRLITIAFQALPMRVGVDEAGAAIFAGQLHLPTATGVTLALVRKLRLLFWSAVGLALIVRNPVPGTRAALLPLLHRGTVTHEQPSC
jgi:Lysylphosphatidylglycerol synthase TM region